MGSVCRSGAGSEQPKPLDRSVAQGDLCHEAPALPVSQPSRSSATGSIDNSLALSNGNIKP